VANGIKLEIVLLYSLIGVLIFTKIDEYVFYLFLSALIIAIWIKGQILILPFIVYPFTNIAKLNHPDSLAIALLPEIILAISFIYSFIKLQYVFISKNKVIEILLIIITILILNSIAFQYIYLEYSEIEILASFRKFIIPLIFILYIYIQSNNKEFYLRLIYFFTISLSIVSFLAIINYLYNFNSSGIDALNPTLLYMKDGNQGQRMFFGFEMKRMQVFTGGMIGSASGIYAALGIYTIENNKLFKKFGYILGVVLLMAAILTLSYTPYLILALYILLKCIKYKFIGLILTLIIILFLYSYTNMNFIPSYMMNTFSNLNLGDAKKYGILAVILGFSPWIGSQLTAGQIYSVLGTIDIGFFRLFFDFGAVVLLFFSIFIGCIVLKILTNFKYSKVSLYIIFIALIIGIHGVVILSIPFFLIFAAMLPLITREYE
jgi:hypothetical protein